MKGGKGGDLGGKGKSQQDEPQSSFMKGGKGGDFGGKASPSVAQVAPNGSHEQNWNQEKGGGKLQPASWDEGAWQKPEALQQSDASSAKPKIVAPPSRKKEEHWQSPWEEAGSQEVVEAVAAPAKTWENNGAWKEEAAGSRSGDSWGNSWNKD